MHWEEPEGSGREGGGRGGSGWGIHVNPWLIHVNVWQKPLQYCKVISLQLIKKMNVHMNDDDKASSYQSRKPSLFNQRNFSEPLWWCWRTDCSSVDPTSDQVFSMSFAKFLANLCSVISPIIAILIPGLWIVEKGLDHIGNCFLKVVY